VNVVGIDPSVHGTGIAIFEGGVLTRVFVNDTKIIARTHSYGEIARRALSDICKISFPWTDWIICEVPQIYKDSPGDPNDLVAVSMVAGALCATIPALNVHTVKPKEWKGQVPKQVHHPRIWRQLVGMELAVATAAKEKYGPRFHNAMDAIGLGLWKLRKEGKR
jgi:hypothetical protein